MRLTEKGYTLVELILVIAIIALLITLSIPAYNSFISPQEFRSAALQIKSDLRTLQNRASSGVTSKRSDVDTRVFWVAKFTNGANTYEMGACVKSLALKEIWSSCEDKQTISLPQAITISTCSGDCSAPTSYAMFFSPVAGNLEVYKSTGSNSIESATFPTTTAATPPIILKLTSTKVANRSMLLTVTGDGSVSESCLVNGASTKCN